MQSHHKVAVAQFSEHRVYLH